MKRLNDIREQIDPCLQKIEKERLETLEKISKSKQLYVLPVLLLIFAAVSFFADAVELTVILSFCAVVTALIITVYYITSYRTSYRTNFKKEAFSAFVEALYPSVYYAAGNYVPSSLFDRSGLFGSHNTYEGEDYFEGKTESGHSFKFSELDVSSTETSTDFEGNVETETTAVFTGLFFVLSVPHRTTSLIQVLPDTAESTFGVVGKFFQESVGALFQRSTMVYMNEHPEFEKEFVVYGKNKEEVYRILSPALLQAIYDLRYKWKIRLSISFIGHYMYIAMPTNKNFFHPNIKDSVLEDKLLRELYNELALCFSVVEDLSVEPKPNENRRLLNSKDNPFLV
jgi:hypothetical protein